MCFQAPDASQSEASVVSDGCSSPSGVAVEQLLDTRSLRDGSRTPVRDLVTTGDAETQVSEHHLTWYVRSQYASISECSCLVDCQAAADDVPGDMDDSGSEAETRQAAGCLPGDNYADFGLDLSG